ncbi:MAG: 6,7-dimethyl-8-ribityllumazine synthase [Polyangiaceae bacterium]|nr:6,7-dimethyl-8-ribityllumazine synthase [Polyangiaceae bacterium]
MHKKIRTFEGSLVVPGDTHIAIVASRFNSFIVDRLIEGATDALLRHGCESERITLIRVPGAWEIPQTVAHLAAVPEVTAIIALGAVIRGDTPHFEYVAGEVSKGLALAAMQNYSKPVAFGVLTTDTLDQAIDRAGAKSGNKGFEAAQSVIEMISLYDEVDEWLEGLKKTFPAFGR